MNKIIRKINKNGQFTKTSFWVNVTFIKKTASILLMTLMLFSFLNIKETKSYYNDIEISNGNFFSAGFLDFSLTNDNLENIIGPEALGEVSHLSVVMPVDNSLSMQYDIETMVNINTSDIDFCNGLVMEANLNGTTKYNGSLSGFTNPTTETFGDWEFRFSLPPDVSIVNGVECNASVLFSAWLIGVDNKKDSGWYDEEILNISLTSLEFMAITNTTLLIDTKEVIKTTFIEDFNEAKEKTSDEEAKEEEGVTADEEKEDDKEEPSESDDVDEKISEQEDDFVEDEMIKEDLIIKTEGGVVEEKILEEDDEQLKTKTENQSDSNTEVIKNDIVE